MTSPARPPGNWPPCPECEGGNWRCYRCGGHGVISPEAMQAIRDREQEERDWAGGWEDAYEPESQTPLRP